VEVMDEEFRDAVKRIRAKNRAPGPSGVPGRAWTVAGVVAASHFRQIFDDCLKSGVFPQLWKIGPSPEGR